MKHASFEDVFPKKVRGIFQSAMLVYQRVTFLAVISDQRLESRTLILVDEVQGWVEKNTKTYGIHGKRQMAR